MKRFAQTVGWVALLSINLVIIKSIFGGLLPLAFIQSPTQEELLISTLALFAVAIIYSILMLYTAKRLNSSGIKHVMTLYAFFWTLTVFLLYIENFVFLDIFTGIMTKKDIIFLSLESSITGFIYCFLITIVAKKWKRNEAGKMVALKVPRSKGELIVKTIITGVIYLVIYYLFGKFVFMPLAGTENFDSYYGETGFPPWLAFFQIGRGMIWVLCLLPFLGQYQAAKNATAITVGLLSSILPAFLLIVPNPFMPLEIRMAHLVEVMSSNFLFGVLMVYIVLWSKKNE